MQCSVCYTNKNLFYTACNHNFCENCIKTWLEIKKNCPVCRRSVWGYRKCKIICKKNTKFVRKVPPKTRSKTRQNRLNRLSTFLDNSYNEYNNIFNNNDNDIHIKMKLVDKIFKEIISNLTLIRQLDRQLDSSYTKSISDLIQQLENSPNVVNNNYLDKIKLWKYKFNNY
jgi:hypothetical protein